jgi:DNA topoisomerase-2
MVQTTLKTTKTISKKRPKPESDEDEDAPSDIDSMHDVSLLSNTPPSTKKQKKAPAAKKGGGKPLYDIENESMNFDGGADLQPMTKKKDATAQYQKLTQLEHIIKRPDTYIGSVERTTETMWVFNSEASQM